MSKLILLSCIALMCACTTTSSQTKQATKQQPASQPAEVKAQAQPATMLSSGSPYVLGAKWTYKKVKSGKTSQQTTLYRVVKKLERGTSGFVRVSFADGSRINLKGGDVYTFERTFPGNFTTMALQYKASAPDKYSSVVHGKDVEVTSEVLGAPLKVEAGTFKDCITYVAKASNFERTTVRCKGVGMVRQSDVFFNKDRSPKDKTVVTLESYVPAPDGDRTTP